MEYFLWRWSTESNTQFKLMIKLMILFATKTGLRSLKVPYVIKNDV